MPGVNEDNSDSIIPKICDSFEDLASVCDLGRGAAIWSKMAKSARKPRHGECTRLVHCSQGPQYNR